MDNVIDFSDFGDMRNNFIWKLTSIFIKIFNNVLFLNLNWPEYILKVFFLMMNVTKRIIISRWIQQVLWVKCILLWWLIIWILNWVVIQINWSFIKWKWKEELRNPVIFVQIHLLLFERNYIGFLDYIELFLCLLCTLLGLIYSNFNYFINTLLFNFLLFWSSTWWLLLFLKL
jgi:hypothetical protein